MGLQGAPSGVKPSQVSASMSCLREVKGGSSVLTKRMVSLGWSPTVHTVQPCPGGDTCAGLVRASKARAELGKQSLPQAATDSLRWPVLARQCRQWAHCVKLGVVTAIAPHVAGHGVEYPHLHAAREVETGNGTGTKQGLRLRLRLRLGLWLWLWLWLRLRLRLWLWLRLGLGLGLRLGRKRR
jgi:hypothetical protein